MVETQDIAAELEWVKAEFVSLSFAVENEYCCTKEGFDRMEQDRKRAEIALDSAIAATARPEVDGNTIYNTETRYMDHTKAITDAYRKGREAAIPALKPEWFASPLHYAKAMEALRSPNPETSDG